MGVHPISRRGTALAGSTSLNTAKGRAVARMLGKIGLRPFVYGVGTGRVTKCLGCPVEDCGYQKPKKTWRQREKRATQKWLDEYEDRPEDEAGACAKGGLACTCVKLPEECPHLDWECWDNDFRRPAIGELFDINPQWTLDSLQVGKTALHWHGSTAL